jgi:hypothetical protein
MKTLFISICLLTALLGQTACPSSSYRIVKSEIPPALGKGNITGKVLSEADGKPLENVDVLLCRDAVMLAGCTGQIGQTKTDQNGVYWFRNLPSGSYVPAIKQSEKAIFVLQEKKQGEYSPKPILFKLEAGQTVQIEPQKLTVESQSSPAVNLIFPTNFQTIRERKPKLTWEANPNAEDYGPYLIKIDDPTNDRIDIDLESGKLAFVKTTSVSPIKELEDGIYEWGIYPNLKGDGRISPQPMISKGYFVVVGETQSEK